MADDRRPIVVLLVDDQPFIGVAVGRLLATEADIEVHSCTSSVEAVERATQLTPTIILQDLVMPGIDGVKLLELYRANAATNKIPVIVLSGNEDAEGRSRAMAAGANDYLVKLPPKEDLVACIRQHAAGSSKPVAPAPEVSAPSKSNGVTLDQGALALLREAGPTDSSAFFVGLLDQFLKEGETRIGLLKRAALGRDVAALKSGAHSLKGTSKIMGAMRLAKLCTDVEHHLEQHLDGSNTLTLVADIDEEFDRVRKALAIERQRVTSPNHG